MDKNALLKVVRDCSASADDATELLSLCDKYPYSQVLHALSAKVARDHELPSQGVALQLAAVYASDRHVLKEIMSSALVTITVVPDRVVEKSEQSHAEPISLQADVQKNSEQSDSQEGGERFLVQSGASETFYSPDLAETVLRDLRKLSESKHNFEMLFADHSTVSVPSVLPGSEPAKTKREKIIEVAKSVNLEHDPEPPVVSRRKKRDHPPETILDEIKTSKEEIAPESERQKEQIQIIDHFIKTQPSIASPRDRAPEPVTDLNSIKSGEFGEHIVSETLVEILIKQGKKERAIEVLKKLIWKYPQKKAYFASQIEDLKK